MGFISNFLYDRSARTPETGVPVMPKPEVPDPPREPTAAPEPSASPDPASPAYREILETVQNSISENNARSLSESLTDDTAKASILDLILRYLTDHGCMLPGVSAETLARRLHTDMCGFSVLDPYLHDPHVEEINVNRYNDIEILYSNGTWEKLPAGFSSPQQAQDIARRLVHFSGKVLDSATPSVDAFTEAGVRIHAKIPPIISLSDGTAMSIRKQTASLMTTEQMIASGVATDEMLLFLRTCLAHGVSVGIAGETGCGKTTDVTYLLNSLPYPLRIITIEDTREIVINPVPDADGIDQRRFTQECTRHSDDPRYVVTIADLVRDTLRQHPDVVAVAEMRGAEAMDTKNAAESGTTVITTFHARTSAQAYTRLMSLCQMDERTALAPEVLMKNLVELFPVMVHKVTMGDGHRRMYEIVEAVGADGCSPVVRPIFRFDLRDQQFHRVGVISRVLAERMLLKGGDPSVITRFLMPPENPPAPARR